MCKTVLWVVLSEERVFKEGQGQQKKFNAQVDQDSLGHIRQTRSDIRAVKMLMSRSSKRIPVFPVSCAWKKKHGMLPN